LKAREEVMQLLVQNLDKNLVLAIEEALVAGARIAHANAAGMHEGHLAHALGTWRHYKMNEAFAAALLAAGAAPTPVKGNSIVVGHAGILKLARLNVRSGPWDRARRSTQRLILAAANDQFAELFQPSLFDEAPRVSEGTVFFVSVFNDSPQHDAEEPLEILVAVPTPGLKSWPFCRPLSALIEAYSRPVDQVDHAKPKLKASVRRKNGTEGQQ